MATEWEDRRHAAAYFTWQEFFPLHFPENTGAVHSGAGSWFGLAQKIVQNVPVAPPPPPPPPPPPAPCGLQRSLWQSASTVHVSPSAFFAAASAAASAPASPLEPLLPLEPLELPPSSLLLHPSGIASRTPQASTPTMVTWWADFMIILHRHRKETAPRSANASCYSEVNSLGTEFTKVS